MRRVSADVMKNAYAKLFLCGVGNWTPATFFLFLRAAGIDPSKSIPGPMNYPFSGPQVKVHPQAVLFCLFPLVV